LKKEDFLKTYSRLSNIELLKILGEKQNYQPIAIEAATEILSQRNCSPDELHIAQDEIMITLNKKLEQKEKIDKVKNRVREFIDEYFGLHQRSPQKKLNLFCAIIFLYVLFGGIFNIRDIAGYYYSTFTSWSIAILAYLLQLLFIYLLYKRSNWGWVILVAGCILLAMQNIQSFLQSFKPRTGLFDLLYEPINPYHQVLAFCINICVVLFLNSNSIRQQFTISKDGRTATLIVAASFSAIFIFVFRYM
jgi:hypothetical protein